MYANDSIQLTGDGQKSAFIDYAHTDLLAFRPVIDEVRLVNKAKNIYLGHIWWVGRGRGGVGGGVVGWRRSAVLGPRLLALTNPTPTTCRSANPIDGLEREAFFNPADEAIYNAKLAALNSTFLDFSQWAGLSNALQPNSNFFSLGWFGMQCIGPKVPKIKASASVVVRGGRGG